MIRRKLLFIFIPMIILYFFWIISLMMSSLSISSIFLLINVFIQLILLSPIVYWLRKKKMIYILLIILISHLISIISYFIITAFTNFYLFKLLLQGNNDLDYFLDLSHFALMSGAIVLGPLLFIGFKTFSKTDV